MARVDIAATESLRVRAAEQRCEIIGTTVSGEKFELSMPLLELVKLCAHALRGDVSYRSRLATGNAELQPHAVAPTLFETVDVLQQLNAKDPAVFLVFDKGREMELAFRLLADNAEALGRALVDRSGQARRPVSPALRPH